ncbi:hypothetical protein WK52_00110 [Burkholderia multivorans]|nr:hypothetical protein WK52_00110 [Burkholderia multivorans]
MRTGLSVYCAAAIYGLSVAAMALRLRFGWSEWATDAQRYTYAPPVTLVDSGFGRASYALSATAHVAPGTRS